MLKTSIMESKSSEGRVLKTPLDGIYAYIAQRFGGKKAKEVERFLKFATVGFGGAIIDFAVMNILLNTLLSRGIPTNVAAATTVAFITAVSSNFIFNRYWTYPDSRSTPLRKQLTQFFLISIVGGVGRTIWITLAFVPLGLFVSEVIHALNPAFVANTETVNSLGQNVALLIGIFVVMIWNFFANRYWTYSDIE
jgi:putative flippase GtrA